MSQIVIIGAGSMGRIVYEFLQDPKVNKGFSVKGFLDSNPDALSQYEITAPILSDIDCYQPMPQDYFVLAIADPIYKEQCFLRFKEKAAKFFTLIHPTAYVSDTVKLNEGCIVAPYAYIAVNAVLGRSVFVNAFSSVGHDACIGDFTTMFSHCSINGFCKIGKSSLLGAHTVVVPQVEVGEYVKVVAGSTIINNNTSPKTLVMGVPASEVMSLE